MEEVRRRRVSVFGDREYGMWEVSSKITLYVTRACPALRIVFLSFSAVPYPLPTSLLEKVIVLHGSGLEQKEEQDCFF